MADYDIGAAFSAIEDELISSMIRNLERHKAEEIAEGMNWSQWQVEQLKALEDYKRKNAAKFSEEYSTMNQRIRQALQESYHDGATSQERKILQSIKRAYKGTGTNKPAFTGNTTIAGEFFKTNDRKLDALIKATADDMQRAETAVLRMADDKYRKIIFNAQVYANTGAGTYEKSVDMATKDFLSAGINCIEYKNGRRVNIKSYAEMAIRTANKRAYLQGEGEMRNNWGIHTVILNKRSNACPLCIPFLGKVIVDDVWSGGTAEEAEEKGYLLMSDCIAQGLYHPSCKDSHSTYFGDIFDDDEEDEEESEEESKEQADTKKEAAENKPNESSAALDPITPKEQKQCEELYTAEQNQQYAQRQAEKWERLAKYSLDKDNKKMYRARQNEWKGKESKLKEYVHKLKNAVANSAESGIIKLNDIFIGRSVGAKAKNYDILDPDTGDYFNFVEGTRIQNPKVFAGKGGVKPLNPEVAEGLSEQIGGKAENWQHCKGKGIVDYYGEERTAEVHWFQEETVGKHKFKIKRWLDDED